MYWNFSYLIRIVSCGSGLLGRIRGWFFFCLKKYVEEGIVVWYFFNGMFIFLFIWNFGYDGGLRGNLLLVD